MKEGKTLFLFDEDKIPGHELTKAMPTLSDFKGNMREFEQAEFIVYVRSGDGFTVVLKNRYGKQGFVI